MSMCPTRVCRPRSIALVAVALLHWSSRQSNAAVTTVGAVTPIPPAGGGTSNAQWIVGSGTVNTGTDIWGWSSIDGGTLLQYGTLIVGNNEGFFGQVDVSGDFLAGMNTKLNLSAPGRRHRNPTVQIGNQGTGYLNVSGGSTMTLTSQNAGMAVGLQSTGVGNVTVSDQFTILTAPLTLVVGQAGYGTLSIEDGALVRTQQTSRANFVSIGRDAGGVGNVSVDGLGSLLQCASSLRVGESGLGTLSITHGGMVNVIDGATPLIGPPQPFMSIGTNATGVGSAVVDGNGSRLLVRRDLQIGNSGQGSLKISNGGLVQILDNPAATSTILVGPYGRIDLDGGTLAGSTPDPAAIPATFGTIVNGYLGGSGLVRGTVQVGEDAFLEAHRGDMLRFDGAVSNQGSVTVDGGELQFNKSFTNNAAAGPIPLGRVAVENGGTVRFTEPLTNDGVLSSAIGATNFYGTISNPGTIVVSRDSVASFYGSVTSSGTITVLPGGNALFLADLTFTSAGAGAGDFGGALSGGGAGGEAALILGIDTENPGGASSHVNVSGVATLAGTLELSLEGGFSSLVGQTLNLITANNVVGAFDSVLLPPVPNDLAVDLVYTPTGVAMQITTIAGGIPGDYNEDGIVNAADYTVWRDRLGSPTSLPNDDTPGVGQDDYARWKTHFGETAPLGTGSISTSPPLVPEPTSWFLATVGVSALLSLRAKRRGGPAPRL